MEVTPLAFLVTRLAIAYDADPDTNTCRRARAEIAAIPDDVTAVRVCALCGSFAGWVA